MKKLAWTALIAAIALLGGAAGFAHDHGEDQGKEVTLEGQVMCAKCTLHAKDAKGCQNVLVVEKDGESKHYYIARNATYEKYGEVCTGVVPVRVTGTVKEEGGHTWIVASNIENVKKAS